MIPNEGKMEKQGMMKRWKTKRKKMRYRDGGRVLEGERIQETRMVQGENEAKTEREKMGGGLGCLT